MSPGEITAIAGHYVRGGPAEPELVGAMLRALEHRGPAGRRTISWTGCEIGYRWCGEPAPGAGGAPVVIAGEIENPEEVGAGHPDSAAGLLWQRFREGGVKALAALDGAFVIALWQEASREFFLIRDRIGVRPLYFVSRKNDLLFASELKALLAVDDVNTAVDDEAIADYVTFGYVRAPRTMLREISKIPPAHLLHVSPEATRMVRWWDPAAHLSERPVPLARAAGVIRDTLEDAVRDRLRRHPSAGVFLTGGLDSSALAACAAKISNERIATFGIRIPGWHADESGYAEFAATSIGASHHHLSPAGEGDLSRLAEVVWQLDEPLAESGVPPPGPRVPRRRSLWPRVAVGGGGG